MSTASLKRANSSDKESHVASPARPEEDDNNFITLDQEGLDEEDPPVQQTQLASGPGAHGARATEEGEEDELPSDEEDFVFKAFKIQFPADFKRHAKHAAVFTGAGMPELIPLTMRFLLTKRINGSARAIPP